MKNGTCRDFIDGGCKWITGEPGLHNKPDWHSCGNAVLTGTSWCPAHYARMFRDEPNPYDRSRRSVRNIERLSVL